MKITGENVLPGTPETLWGLITDPDVLVAAIPGCKHLDKIGEDEYKGVIGAKVGAIQSQYTTQFEITDKNYPTSYLLKIDGKGPGGFVKGDVLIELIPDGDHQTTMRHQADAQVGGKIARVGQRMVQAAANMMVDKSLKSLRDRLEEELGPAPEPTKRAVQPAKKGFFATLLAFLKKLFGRAKSTPSTET